MKFMKLLAPVLMAVLLALPVSFASASETVTDVFEGRATTGVDGPMPVDVDPTNIKIRADGAVGVGYTYKAAGQATGDVDGKFQYEEHGYLFFRNPADPRTFVGGRYDGGVITLQTEEHRSVTIADTNPAGYQSALRSMRLPTIDPLLLGYGEHVFTHLGLHPVAGVINYGTFTFATSEGTFWGVSTPDSRHYLLRLRFSLGKSADNHGKPVPSIGSNFNQNSHFRVDD